MFKVGDKVRLSDESKLLKGYKDGVLTIQSTERGCAYFEESNEPVSFCYLEKVEEQHPHAEIIMEYAKLAQVMSEPWERMQVRYKGSVKWVDCAASPHFDIDSEYRLKPHTININGFEVTEPMRVKPDINSHYWYVATSRESGIDYAVWQDDIFDNRMFALGLCHSTKEAAKLNYEALISLTVVKHE